MRYRHLAFQTFVSLVLLATLTVPEASAYNYPTCGNENRNDCDCGRANYCYCCGDTCGNCVWHAWQMACCHWGRALEWCTDAQYWNDRAQEYGYPTGGDPCDNSIFVCEPSDACSGWGHVGWIVTAHPDGSFSSTEQFCGGQCGTHERTRPAGYATGGFIYNPDGGCQENPTERDDAALVSETVPAGTHFKAGAQFVKRWTMRNTGTTTWTTARRYCWNQESGEGFDAEDPTWLPDGVSVAPGDDHAWDVSMTAPSQPGSYKGNWIMDHRENPGESVTFGDMVSIEIIVDPTVDGDNDGYDQQNDCNDSNPDIHPGAAETCNGFDDDCDTSTDEEVKNRCGTCGPEPEEVYDRRDNDCDGLTDEGLEAPDAGVEPEPDAGKPHASDAESATDGQSGGGGEGINGGCGCRQTGGAMTGSIAVLLGLLACAAAFRKRRRREKAGAGAGASYLIIPWYLYIQYGSSHGQGPCTPRPSPPFATS